MNRGSLNTYSLNAAADRGGVIRVAADLLAEAFIVAQARVWRRFNEVAEVRADIGPVVGRVFARGALAVEATADIVLTNFRFLRDVFSVVGSAVVGLAARAGRREPMAPSGAATVNLIGRAFRRQPASVTGEAVVSPEFRAWRISPTVFEAATEIVLTPRVIVLRYLRALADFVGESLIDVLGRMETRQPTVFDAQAIVDLTAGVQNDFAYDEDAPDERTFYVTGGVTVFTVVN
jgi:hypothetical protein